MAFGATVAGARGRPLQMASLTGYGLSPVTPYGASAPYHAVRAPRLKARLGTVDHAAIVLPIAGTGTPFLLIGLCAVLWPPTVLGVACKLRGGLAYTLGIVFYAWHGLRHRHAVRHLFVMAGSGCHFAAVALAAVPGA